jgi:hypothetical protein
MGTSPGQEVEAMLAVDLSGLDQVGLQSLAQQLRQAAGRISGKLDQVLAVLDASGDGSVQTNPGSEHAAIYQSVEGWWRDTATIPGHQSGRELRRARVLRELPLIGQAVIDGVLAPDQAAVLCRLHGAIPIQALLESQTSLIQVARERNTDALAAFVRHLIATHCEPALEAEQDRAHEKRYLQLSTEPDGTVRGRFVLTSEDAEAVLTVLEPLARQQGLADKRSAGQRRADALVEVFAGATAWMDLPQAGGQRAQLSYVINAAWSAGDTPVGLQEQLARQGMHPNVISEHCAAAAWTGPQTRARIESLLCDSRISRLVLDSRGEVVALHSLTDQITNAQRRGVSARDRHCIAKGCTRPPAFCDVHHLEHRADGGKTTIDNLVLLCRRHHVLWHRGTLGRHQLHTPWLPEPEPDRLSFDPWAQHNPPQVA